MEVQTPYAHFLREKKPENTLLPIKPGIAYKK